MRTIKPALCHVSHETLEFCSSLAICVTSEKVVAFTRSVFVRKGTGRSGSGGRWGGSKGNVLLQASQLQEAPNHKNKQKIFFARTVVGLVFRENISVLKLY